MRVTLSFILKQTIVKCSSPHVFAAALLLLCLATLSKAQDDSNPKRGFYPGGSYSISDIEAINTANGNLIVNLPIASLPAGRGGARGPGLSLTYNSKIWDVEVNAIPGEPGTGEGITFRNLAQSHEGGWRYSLPVYSLNDDEFVPAGTNCNGGYVHRLTITFPDGSRHEFYPSGYTIKNSSGGVKYSQIRYDGFKAGYFIPEGGDCILTHNLETTNTITYYSIDGTYLRLDVLHGGSNPWILYFPDGTRVETPSFTTGDQPDFQRTFDRNNNYTDYQRIHNYNGTGRTADKLSDEFGRYILLDNGTVTAQGINAVPLVWTIAFNNDGQTIVNKTYCDHFGTNGCDSTAVVNVSRNELDHVTLPPEMGGLSYHFGYNTSAGGWGELSSITLPSGATANYHYEQDGQDGIAWHKVRDNGVARKDLNYLLEYDGTSTATTDSWLYSYNHTSAVTTITAPDGGISTEYHFSNADPGLGNESKGLLYKVTRPDGGVEENVYQPNTPAGVVEFSNQPIKLNPFLKTKFVSITNLGGQPTKTAVTDYSYDKNGNVTAVREYDWIDYTSILRDTFGRPLDASQQTALNGKLKRLTTNSYFNQTPDAADTTTNSVNAYSRGTSPKLRSVLAVKEIGTGSQVQARSEFSYDDANNTGNQTSVKQWDSAKAAYTNPLTTANSIVTSSEYGPWPGGATGKLLTTTDARGIQTKFTYGQVGLITDLYPTKVEVAYSTPVQATTESEYDFSTGLVTKTTDTDNAVSTKTTYDAVGRPTLVQSAYTLPEESRVATQYFDSERKVIVRSDLTTMGDAKLVSIQHYDQLGRVRLTRKLEDSSISGAETSESVGIKVQTRYGYSTGNSWVVTSNPYRAATSTAASTENTMGWTRTKADVAGRVVEVQTFGGSGLPAPWGSSTISTGTVTKSYDSYLTKVVDQTGKLRRSKVDALGRLVRVDEPVLVNGTDDLGDGENPLQQTSYTYDALGNVTNVTQGTQTRTFAYSSLSRLSSAQNPENGFTSYKYDENGNVRVKTDARLVSAHFTYDQLNRVTRRWYNSTSAVEDTPSNENLPSGVGVTPQVNFYYDAHPATSPFFAFQSQDKSKGRLTAVTYGLNSTTGDYYRYDVLGRTFAKIQRLGAQDYQVTAQYNRANAITSLTYPSGHVVTNSLDTAGRLSAMSGNLGDGASRTYSTGILYSANGGLVKEQFGTTNTAIYNKLFYNSRGQLAEIRVSTSYTGVDDTTFDRGAIVNHYSDQCPGRCAPDANGPKAMTDNNGNIKKQEIYIPGSDTRAQLYAYDELNRLKSAREVTAGTEQWRQWFQYDQYGNRSIDNSQDAGDPHPRTYGAGINNTSFTVNLNNDNRLGVPSGQNKIMHYDAAGNLDNDTYTGAGNRTYDAENRITSAFGGVSPGQAQLYTYDGSGQRVKRIVEGVETWVVYGFAGETVAEYPANIAAATPQKEYGHRNGQLLVTATTTASWGPAPTMDDNPLNPPGQPKTDIKAIHITQLRTAINALRAHYNLPNYQWAKPTASGGAINNTVFISWEPIDEMRTALNQALGAPPLGYAAGLALGQPILAVHIQELRDRVLAAWSTGSAVDLRWLVTDHLGTPRIILDQSGSLAAVRRHDYLPFGEELLAGAGGRTAGQGYAGDDGVRQQFTEKERDVETGLDFFGARYFSSTQGRFTSVDPLAASAKPANPQSWNRYAYVLNNPLRLVDPTGMAPQDPSRPSTKKEAAFFLKHPKIATEIGSVERGGTNISTIAARFSESLGLDNTRGEGSEVNAFRHVLWQAMIASKYGPEIATEVGNAHEDEVPQQVELATFIGPENGERADTAADLMNNETGRAVAAANPNASTTTLAAQVLETFHTTGLVTTQTESNGWVRTVVTRITDQQYQNAQRLLAPLNNNGFTQAQQQQHDEERARRGRIPMAERH